MTVKIKGEDFQVKYTIRALFIFEQITEKSFELKNSLDTYIFYYSMLLANNSDKNLSWDEFLEEIDNNPELSKQFVGYLTEFNESQKILEKEVTDPQTGVKKKKESQ